MSAFNLPPHAARAALLSALLVPAAAGMHDAIAQGTPIVIDADIEHAKRGQPVITDEDIARAQKKHRMPTEQDLSRIPIPAAPNLDALPRPHASQPVDLEALARDYEADVDRMAAAQGMSTAPSLLIFVSFSMPQPSLERLVEQAEKSQASLVVRGLVNGSLRDTIGRMQSLIGKRQIAFQIDPQAFDRFSISKTPTFVLVRAGAQAEQCGAGLCFPHDAFAAASGDVSLDYALEFIERQSPRFAKDARNYLQKIRG